MTAQLPLTAEIDPNGRIIFKVRGKYDAISTTIIVKYPQFTTRIAWETLFSLSDCSIDFCEYDVDVSSITLADGVLTFQGGNQSMVTTTVVHVVSGENNFTQERAKLDLIKW